LIIKYKAEHSFYISQVIDDLVLVREVNDHTIGDGQRVIRGCGGGAARHCTTHRRWSGGGEVDIDMMMRAWRYVMNRG
jgi:hypothetical protein